VGGGGGDEQELCAYCMLFLFVLSLSVYILAEHLCCTYPGHSKVGGLSDGETDNPSNARLEPSPLRPVPFHFSSWRGLFVPVLLRVGTVHPPPRFIVTLTTHQRRAPQPLLRPSWAEITTCIPPPLSLHACIPPSLHTATHSLWARKGVGRTRVGVGGLRPCWLQSYRISKFSIFLPSSP
jgi:hypothetical protein